jgi:hypothetical protein
MTYLLFASALALSSIAGYYSIMGLIAIFSGAPVSIAIMGGTLEVSKLVVTSWLYRNWKDTPRLLKLYFVIAISILMLITSMGIFGYLSKAHLEQGVASNTTLDAIAILDEKIKIQKDNISETKKTLSQMDAQVETALSRSSDVSGTNTSVSIRRSQARERNKLAEEILRSQVEIAKLTEQRTPLAIELRKIEVEVGPIKYIAALLYDTSDATTLEKAVRIMILMLVFVFDPLAVLMFIAVNQSSVKIVKSNKTITVEENSAIVEDDKTIYANSEVAARDQFIIEKWSDGSQHVHKQVS